jgi:putative ABC transport system permease protein
VLLFQQALLTAVLDGLAGAIGKQSAPVVVYARDAQRAVGASLLRADQVAAVKASPGVADAAELAVTLLTFRGPKEGAPPFGVNAIGFRPGRPGTPTAITAGRAPTAPGEVAVSSEAAYGRFGLGDTITVETGGIPLTVVGLTEGALLSIGPALWTPWETYDQLVRAASQVPVVLPAAIAVQPAPGTTPEQLAQTLNAAFPQLDAMTREQAVLTVPGRDAIKGAFGLVGLLCYIVVGVVIGFFFLTMTLHKESSITLMRAIGIQGGYLVRCLLLQVALVTSGALVIGLLMLIAVRPLVRTAVAVPVDPAAVVATAIPSMIVALLGALAPIRRVLRVDPNAIVSRPRLGGVS